MDPALRFRRLVLLASFLGGALPGVAEPQSPPQPQTAQAPVTGAVASKPVGAAGRTGEAPVIDGRLDENLWQAARPMTGLVQTEPEEGRPATERTEVRFLYDDKHTEMD